MATLTAAVCSAVTVPQASSARASASPVGVSFAPCMGLKSGKSVPKFGAHASIEERWANVARSCRSTGKGALGARCDVGSEVLAVVPVIGAMILTGIALGFVLLRVEAAIEEAE